MTYYSLLLNLKNKKCLVIGGGRVAERKVRSLLKAEALIRVISPTLTKGLSQLRGKKRILYTKSAYKKRFIKDSFLVIAATSDKNTNSKLSLDAQSLGILTNVVDSPQESNFIVPASLQKKDLIISISTSGKAPALSKRIRKDLNKLLVPDYAKFLSILEDIRSDLKLRCSEPKLRFRIMNYLASGKIEA